MAEKNPNIQRYEAEKHTFFVELRQARRDARNANSRPDMKPYFQELSRRCHMYAEDALKAMEREFSTKQIPEDYAVEITRMRKMYQRVGEIIKERFKQEAAA